MKQLFVTPPGTPHLSEAKITSQSSEESVFSGKSFHIPKVKYKNRARVFPKNRNPIYPPSYRDSLVASQVRQPDQRMGNQVRQPDQGMGNRVRQPDQGMVNREDQKSWATPAEQRAQDAAMLRASILAARNRVRNHPSFKRLVVPDPLTGGVYNPNRIPFEISEGEEDNYLEDSWDRRHHVGGLKMIGGLGKMETPQHGTSQQQGIHFVDSPFTEEDLEAFEIPEEAGIDNVMMGDAHVEEITEIENSGDLGSVSDEQTHENRDI